MTLYPCSGCIFKIMRRNSYENLKTTHSPAYLFLFILSFFWLAASWFQTLVWVKCVLTVRHKILSIFTHSKAGAHGPQRSLLLAPFSCPDMLRLGVLPCNKAYRPKKTFISRLGTTIILQCNYLGQIKSLDPRALGHSNIMEKQRKMVSAAPGLWTDHTLQRSWCDSDRQEWAFT